ncbi:MAG: rhodanese-like domain-containing protein [Cyanobacteria bacterium J06607_15]
MMLLLRKTIVAAGLFSILAISSGCQNIGVQTESDRQVKIETMYRQYAQEFPQVKGITASKLQQLQQSQQLVLIDVRTPKEIGVSRIPGAITAAEFEANLKQYRDVQAIAYCTIGYRSGLYAQKLAQQGIEVLNLEGSLLAWSHVGGELVNATGRTNKVHVFGRQWRLTSEDYEPVW